jgi:hypothetical protein
VRLTTRLRSARNIEDAIDPAHAEHERQVRERRLELARRRSNWTEIPESRLVRRGGRFLVDAETDLLYLLRRGHVFEPGNATVGYVTESAEMTYYVDAADNIVFLEHPGSPHTWSEIVARKARRGAA